MNGLNGLNENKKRTAKRIEISKTYTIKVLMGIKMHRTHTIKRRLYTHAADEWEERSFLIRYNL